MRINHPKFCGLTSEGVLLVVSLKVVHPIHALFVEYNQSFIRGPAELDNLPLIPLRTRTSLVHAICGLVFGTDRKDQETLSRR